MDWSKIIGELTALGYTQTRIAQECDCGQATISDLACKRNENPRYSIVAPLLLLHRRAQREAKKRQKAAA